MTAVAAGQTVVGAGVTDERVAPTPSKDERWLATGMWEHEPLSEVTIIDTPDPRDSCVDVRYGDGSERLLPRECFVRRLPD